MESAILYGNALRMACGECRYGLEISQMNGANSAVTLALLRLLSRTLPCSGRHGRLGGSQIRTWDRSSKQELLCSMCHCVHSPEQLYTVQLWSCNCPEESVPTTRVTAHCIQHHTRNKTTYCTLLSLLHSTANRSRRVWE